MCDATFCRSTLIATTVGRKAVYRRDKLPYTVVGALKAATVGRKECTVETNCPVVGALIAATVGRKECTIETNCPVEGTLIEATVGRKAAYCRDKLPCGRNPNCSFCRKKSNVLQKQTALQ